MSQILNELSNELSTDFENRYKLFDACFGRRTFISQIVQIARKFRGPKASLFYNNMLSASTFGVVISGYFGAGQSQRSS